FSNYIYPQNTGESNDLFPSLNNYQFRGTNARTFGIETSAEIQLIAGLAFNGTLSYTRGERDLTAKEQKLDPEAAATRPLPMIPPFKASAGLTYAYERFRLVGRTRIAGRQTRTGEFESPTDGYALFDLVGQYRFETGAVLHTISVNAENILDTT